MRGLYSSKTEIRHKIFTEIARMAYEGQSPEMLEELPYNTTQENRNGVYTSHCVGYFIQAQIFLGSRFCFCLYFCGRSVRLIEK